jgi:hypothetical protein
MLSVNNRQFFEDTFLEVYKGLSVRLEDISCMLMLKTLNLWRRIVR